MENLRWILLLAGIVFVIVVYLLSRQRRRSKTDVSLAVDNELPDFSATDDLDNVDEGVGKVRVVTSFDEDAAPFVDGPADIALSEDKQPSAQETQQPSQQADSQPLQQQQVKQQQTGEQQTGEQQTEPVQLIMLYILAEANEPFSGGQINSAARASGMIFGDMNIFHRHDHDNLIQYSMANMVEPGSFDPETLYDMETRGLAVFMQPELVAEPTEALDDMLNTAYQITEMLGGRLCNRKREPLSETDTAQYRQQLAAMTSLS